MTAAPARPRRANGGPPPRAPRRPGWMWLAPAGALLLAAIELCWFDLRGVLPLLLPVARWVVATAVAVAVAALLAVAVRRRRAALAAVAIVSAAVAGLAWTEGRHLGAQLRLARHRATYERTLATVEAAPTGGHGGADDPGGAYRVDPGPPVRIAFVWPGGLLDNWCGAVHDPSRSLSELAAAAARPLFGGTLSRCTVLDGPWYLCCFT